MYVEQLMSGSVKICRPDDSLAAAAKIMWDHDCGCVPVVNDDVRLVGMVTDRDVCMAAYLGGTSLASVAVSSAMSKVVHSCRPDDAVGAAESVMRANQIRRLPVVDAEEHVLGILSLNDIAQEFASERKTGGQAVGAVEIAETLAAICQPHEHSTLAAA